MTSYLLQKYRPLCPISEISKFMDITFIPATQLPATNDSRLQWTGRDSCDQHRLPQDTRRQRPYCYTTTATVLGFRKRWGDQSTNGSKGHNPPCNYSIKCFEHSTPQGSGKEPSSLQILVKQLHHAQHWQDRVTWRQHQALSMAKRGVEGGKH